MSELRPHEAGLELLGLAPGSSLERAWGLMRLALADGESSVPWGPLLRLSGGGDPEDDPDLVDAAREVARLAPFPPVRAPRVHLRAARGLESPDFAIREQWTLPPGETVDRNRLTGAWYDSPRRGPCLLTAAAYELRQVLDEPWPDDRNGRLLHWARLRPFARRAGAELDGYLDAEGDVVAVEAIQPWFEPTDDGGLVVQPGAEGVPPEEFEQAIQGRGRVLGSYTKRGPGTSRRRYVLSPRAQSGLKQVFETPPFDRLTAADVLSRPEAYFDPDLFDLSHYGDRVIGIGPPRYRANVVVASSTDRNWLGEELSTDSVVLELIDDARPDVPPLRVDLTDDARRQAVRGAIADAVGEGRSHADVEGRLVRATPELAATLADLPESKEQLVRPDELKGCVLQIHENIEELGFGGAGSLPAMPDEWRPERPSGLAEDLRLFPYQETGFRWLSWWADAGSRPVLGGLLADDMGLGKTLQVLALLARAADLGRLSPSLVVAPVSVLENWAREARRFAGGAIQTIVDVRTLKRGQEPLLADVDLALTSYETLASRDIEMGRIPWRIVVCDEAQKIKNPSTRACHAVKAMSAELRLAMTGTPVENSLDDLWSVVDYFQPGLLGSLHDFRKTFGAGRDPDPGSAERLKQTLAPVVLRRTKDEVAKNLPPKEEETHEVELSELQCRLYDLLVHRAQHGPSAERLATIHRLLQVCSHPLALLSEEVPGLDLVETAPKLGKALSLLDGIRDRGEKALVFARWYRLQAVLAEAIEGRFGIPVTIINGAVPPRQRQSLIDRFGASPGFAVMVLAPRACGVGLNITAANHVIHYSREWNPAIEAQATDRVYRIGQDRPVTVHRLVARRPGETTADEILDRVLQDKLRLVRDFVQPMARREVRLDDFAGMSSGSSGPGGWGLEDLRLADPARLVAALASAPLTQVQKELQREGPARVWTWAARPTSMLLADTATDALDWFEAEERPGSWRIHVLNQPGWRLRRRLGKLGEVVDGDSILALLEGLGVDPADLLGAG